MAIRSTFATALLYASGALAVANYPAIPKDKTTPVQQRLAYHSPNCKCTPAEIECFVYLG